MVLSVLTTRLLTRLFRRPIGKCLQHRNITGNTAAANVEVNTELLNSFNRDIKSGGVVPVFRRALLFPTRIALQDEVGIYTYAGLHQVAASLSNEISAQLLGETERTIAYMCGNDASHVIVQWAIWMSGNIAVPLTPLHPPEMLKYFIQDSSAALVICSPEYETTMRPVTLEVSVPLMTTGRDKQITAQLYQPNSTFLNIKPEDSLTDVGRSNEFYGNTEAMLIYTSGTTSKPKGVVWTHGMLAAQIAALHVAWQYSAGDVVLHTLPLHHVHGQLNSLNASLAAGARVRMLGSFVPHVVWARLLGMGEREEARPTVLHGVPAMYARLGGERDKLFGDARRAEYVRVALRRLRLACAGSAPLPQRVADVWEEISGQRLLERYGMSEAGMALSNPYRPVEARTVGSVGAPLPGVAARIAAVRQDTGELEPLVTVQTPEPEYQICLGRLGLAASQDSLVESDGYEWKPPTVTRHRESADGVYQGELLLKGPGVFTRYWNRVASLTADDFTADGWFRTGDTASYADGKFRILGRTSIDIIKTGGYKVSALQVESALSEHPSVADVAVLGVEHEDFGETITAVVQLHKGASLTLRELKDDAGNRLAPYQLPRNLLIVDQMPRNAMGKLDKKEIRRLYSKDLVMKEQ